MSKRNLVIVGNWKMNKTPMESKEFFVEFNELYKKNNSKIVSGLRFGMAVPSIDISIVKENSNDYSMILAAEDVHEKESGAYTGDLSATMIKSVGANAVVIGHSERRQYHNETNKDINSKAFTAFKNELLPIICIGETLEQRKSNEWKNVISSQIEGTFKNFTKEQILKVIIAYEPIWAIGTGVTASADEAQEACQYVRQIISSQFSKEVAEQVIIQYGGSVKPANIEELMSKEDIDGALVGGASLEPESYFKLLTLNK